MTVGKFDPQLAEQRMQLWFDLMDLCEEFLLAGLRRKIGPEGDLREAYRQWYAERMAEHDQVMARMVGEFNRRSNINGR
jgi:hypothetical protein